MVYCEYGGKMCHDSAKSAQRSAAAIRARRHEKVGPEIYRCEHCGLWHIAASGRKNAVPDSKRLVRPNPDIPLEIQQVPTWRR